MRQVGCFIHEGTQIATEVDARLAATTKPTSKAFKEFLMKDSAALAKIEDLRVRVEEFAKKFPMPGFDDR